jgi:hypothetical protein
MGPGPGNDASTGQTSGGGWPGTVARCQVQGAQWATQKHRAEERRTAAAAAATATATATAITAAIEQAQTRTRTRTLACRLKRLGKRGLVAAASRRLGLRLRVCDTPSGATTPSLVFFLLLLLLPSPFGLCSCTPERRVTATTHSCLPRPQPPFAASVPGPSYHPTFATPQHLLRNHAQSNGHALFNRHAFHAQMTARVQTTACAPSIWLHLPIPHHASTTNLHPNTPNHCLCFVVLSKELLHIADHLLGHLHARKVST